MRRRARAPRRPARRARGWARAPARAGGAARPLSVMRASIGTPNASVLPEPVLGAAADVAALHGDGIASVWIANGWANPHAARPIVDPGRHAEVGEAGGRLDRRQHVDGGEVAGAAGTVVDEGVRVEIRRTNQRRSRRRSPLRLRDRPPGRRPVGRAFASFMLPTGYRGHCLRAPIRATLHVVDHIAARVRSCCLRRANAHISTFARPRRSGRGHFHFPAGQPTRVSPECDSAPTARHPPQNPPLPPNLHQEPDADPTRDTGDIDMPPANVTPKKMPFEKYAAHVPIVLHRPHVARTSSSTTRRCGAASTCATATRR